MRHFCALLLYLIAIVLMIPTGLLALFGIATGCSLLVFPFFLPLLIWETANDILDVKGNTEVIIKEDDT